MSWSTISPGKYVRYHVIATYNGYLEVIGWTIWDTERQVNVMATETVCNHDALQRVADLLNSGAVVHYVGCEE